MTRSEHYTHDGEARVESRVELSNAPLMQLSVADRQRGRTSTDQDLCRNFARKAATACWSATTASSCCRPAIRSVPGLPTAAPSTGSAEPVASQWDAFAKYRSEGQLAELYLGEPQITSYDISLSGGKTDEPAHSCEIRSPWFDIDLQAEPARTAATTIATGKCRRPVGSTTTRSTAPSSAS